MGFGLGYLIQDDREFDQPNATPKLSLSKLPCKPTRDQQMQMLSTPPLHRSVSIPFKWEEAPGKARDTAASKKGESGSGGGAARRLELPPRLHDQSSCGRIISLMSSPVTVLEGPYVRGRSLWMMTCTFSFRKGNTDKKKMGSWRWGSFKEEKIKMSRLRRNTSTFFINSTFWGDVYASFKQAVPWGHRQFQGV